MESLISSEVPHLYFDVYTSTQVYCLKHVNRVKVLSAVHASDVTVCVLSAMNAGDCGGG